MPVKGAKEFKKFMDNKPLTRKEALLAQCYCCNGYSTEECGGLSCPLYQWSPCNKNRKLTPQTREKVYPKFTIQTNLKGKSKTGEKCNEKRD